MDLIKELKDKGIELKIKDNVLVFTDGIKSKEIAVKDMESYLLLNIVNWFKF